MNHKYIYTVLSLIEPPPCLEASESATNDTHMLPKFQYLTNLMHLFEIYYVLLHICHIPNKDMPYSKRLEIHYIIYFDI